MNSLNRLGGLLLIGCFSSGWFEVAQAQVGAAPDGTGTVVQVDGNTFTVTGGTPAGANLFHSFQQFGLNSNQTADFVAGGAVANILGRVTGGDASVIQGLLRVSGSNANLYLINPAGILFGPGASLNLNGSFTATTANGIGFGDRWFSAVGPNALATLTGEPDALAFTMAQPGAIANAAYLSVNPGRSLTLAGGTVISTGPVLAPGGAVTLLSINRPGWVHLAEPGRLLSVDLPVAAGVNPLTMQPLSLPQLLTGGSLASSTGLTVHADGTVALTGSGLQVQAGDLVATQIGGQTAQLVAARQVTLPSSQLTLTGDMAIRAGDTVQIQDSPTQPSQLLAGGALTIQGDGAIALSAVQSPASVLASGGDMTLRSGSPILGDAHYSVGGSLRFETLTAQPASVLSPDDPVILAQGDVTLGDYTGASLHILAGGQVTVGTVTINAIGADNETIHPANANLYYTGNGTAIFNGTAASLAPVRRGDGSPLTLVGVQGGTETSQNLIIRGNTQPTLDIRAGMDWAALGGLPANAAIGAGVAVPPNQPATSANITVAGITITQPNGVVLLTNQYVPNAALNGGSIQVSGNITDTTLVSDFNPGSTVVIDARTTVQTGDVTTRYGPIQMYGGQTITTGKLLNLDADSAFFNGTVVLRAPGTIQVQGIESGPGGIDVVAGGLFQAVGSIGPLRDIVSSGLPRVDIDLPENVAIKSFLQAQGILNPDGSVNNAANRTGAFDELVFTSPAGVRTVVADISQLPVSVIARNFTPDDGKIRIQHAGEAVATSSTSNITISGSGTTQFIIGPTVTQLPETQFEITTVANGPFVGSRRFKYQQFDAFAFNSDSFPTSVSGTVGAIIVGAGTNTILQTSLQNRPFVPSTDNGGGGGGGGGTGGGGTGGGGTGGGGGEPGGDGGGIRDAQATQRQLVDQREESACGTRGTGGEESRSRGENPCNPSADDQQILQILNESP